MAPPKAPIGTIALVFTDVQGSTRLWERAPELMRAALAVHDALLRSLIAEHDGYEVKTEGDAFMVAFSDPLQAARWALAVQEALVQASWPPGLAEHAPAAIERTPVGATLFAGLRVRAGVHVGEPHCVPDPTTGRMDYFGPMVNRAARVASAPSGGQVVLSGAAWECCEAALRDIVVVENLGLHRLKGLDEPEQLWQVLPRSLRGRTFPPLSSLRVSGNRPYRGLDSFTEADAALYFGRDAETRAFIAAIERAPMVTLTGPSGSGKTSLLRAGVARGLPDSTIVWVRPGADPLGSLVRALREVLAGWRDEFLVYDLVRAAPRQVGSLLRRWAEETGRRLVVVVDQAEELLTLTRDPDQREAFGGLLVALGSEEDAPLRVVISIRGDFFHQLAGIDALRGVYSRAVEVLAPLRPENLREALVEPAAAFGYQFESPALVDSLVDAVADQPASLALLSFCADQLWDHRDQARKIIGAAAVEAVGGPEGALAAHADRAIQALPEAARGEARELFLRLVTTAGTKATVSLDELGGSDRRDLASVVESLVAARILTVSERPERVVELAHEALVEHWGQLRQWLDEDREGQRLHQSLTQAAREWQLRGRGSDTLWRGALLTELTLWLERGSARLTAAEEEFARASVRAGRRARVLAVGALVGALAASLVVAVLFARQAGRADRAAETAENAAVEAQDAAQIARVRGLLAAARGAQAGGRPSAAVAQLAAARSLAPEGERRSLAAELERAVSLPGLSQVLPLRGLQDHGAQRALLKVGLAAETLDGEVVLHDLQTGAERWRVRPGGADAGQDPPWMLASEDGTRIVTLQELEELGIYRVETWQTDTGRVEGGWRTGVLNLDNVALSADGSRLAMCDWIEKRVVVVDAQRGDRVASLPASPESGQCMDLAFSPSGAQLAVARVHAGVQVLDLASDSVVSSHPAHVPGAVAWSEDGGTLYVGQTEGGFDALDVARGRTRWHKTLGDAQTSSIEARSGHVMIRLFRGDVVVLSEKDGFERGRWAARGGGAALSDKGGLVSVPDGPQLRIYDIWNGDHLATLRGHRAVVLTADFADEPLRLVSSGRDGDVRVWPLDRLHTRWLRAGDDVIDFSIAGDPPTAGVASLLEGFRWLDLEPLDYRGKADPGFFGCRVSVSPDGQSLSMLTAKWCYAGGHKYRVDQATSPDDPPLLLQRRMAAADLEPVIRLEALEGQAGSEAAWFGLAELLPSGGVAVSDAAGCVRLYQNGNDAPVALCSGSQPAAALAPSPDGLRIAILDDNHRSVAVWGLDGTRQQTLAVSDDIASVAWSPAGDRLIALRPAGQLTLWDAATGAELWTQATPPEPVGEVAFSADGSALAVGTARGLIQIWSASGEVLRSLQAHVEQVSAVALSPEGDRVVSAAGPTVSVWDVPSGASLRDAETAASTVRFVAFTPSGQYALAVSADGVVREWTTRPLDPDRSTAEAAALTNMRVCADTLEAVAVLPFPTDDDPWGPPELCGGTDPTPPPSTPTDP